MGLDDNALRFAGGEFSVTPQGDHVVVVVPTYNESQNVERIIAIIADEVPRAEIVVVDDASPDGTAEVVEQLSKRYPQVALTAREARTGLGDAYMDEFRRILLTRPDVQAVCTIDADLSHDPCQLPSLLELLVRADVVVGSRYVPGGRVSGWEFWRRALSRGGNTYARFVTGTAVRDLTSGYVCFRSEVLATLCYERHRANGYAYTIESKSRAIRAGFRLQEAPIRFSERKAGVSKLTARVVVEGLEAPWRVRLDGCTRDDTGRCISLGYGPRDTC